MPERAWMRFLPDELRAQAARDMAELTEVRLRAGRPAQLVAGKRRWFTENAVSPEQLREIAVSMMEYSYYAREGELSQGYFTLRDGCRVGVGGAFSASDGGYRLSSIGSLCIRIARERPGCAKKVLSHILENGRVCSALILSPPGMGKTTLLRDLARSLSLRNYIVAIADERGEIAAMQNGEPSLDVGPGTDVIGGCPKHLAMEYLIRSMAPEVLIADELGGRRDPEAVCEAARQGVQVIASAHARDLSDLAHGFRAGLLRAGTFEYVFALGERPGRLAAAWKKGARGEYESMGG